MAINRQQRLLKQGLPGNANFSVGDLSDGAIPQWDATEGKWTLGAGGSLQAPINIGDPGFEDSAVTLDGSSFSAVAKINEFGGSQKATLILHRHDDSAGVSANLLLSRARGETATHDDVQNNEILGRLVFAGWHTDSYWSAARIEARVNGTPGDGDMPAELRFLVTPDGSNTPAEALRIEEDGDAFFSGNVQIDDGKYLRIYDATNSDYSNFVHNGTDFETTFQSTADWDIYDLTAFNVRDGGVIRAYDGTNAEFVTVRSPGGGVGRLESSNALYLSANGATTLQLFGNSAQFISGQILRVFDATNADRIEFSHNGTNGVITTNAGDILFQPAGNTVDILNGAELRIRDATNADNAEFSHNGTDFVTNFTNTGKWQINTDVSIVGYIDIEDGSTAPTAVAGRTFIYVDSADGDLKVRFGDGTTKTLATDT